MQLQPSPIASRSCFASRTHSTPSGNFRRQHDNRSIRVFIFTALKSGSLLPFYQHLPWPPTLSPRPEAKRIVLWPYSPRLKQSCLSTWKTITCQKMQRHGTKGYAYSSQVSRPFFTIILNQSLEYNVPGGKLNRGISVVDTVQILRGRELSEQEYFEAALLGWCIEFVRFSFPRQAE